jgi:hypothetical protein
LLRLVEKRGRRKDKEGGGVEGELTAAVMKEDKEGGVRGGDEER